MRPGSDSGSLELDDVPKRYPVKVNDVVSTSGWQDEKENFGLPPAEGHPDRRRDAGQRPGRRAREGHPGDAAGRPRRVLARARPDARAGPRRDARRIAGDIVVLGVILPLAVLLQLAVASDLSLVAGAPDLVLIVVCGVALARGPSWSAAWRASAQGSRSTCWPSMRSVATR